MIFLTLDGQQIDNREASGLQDVRFVARATEGVLQREITNEIKFTGSAYDLIRAKLIDDPNALVNKIIAVVTDDCCPNEFVGIIDSKAISFCSDDCTIKAKIVEDNTVFSCFKSTAIADDWNSFQSAQFHPRMIYCNEMRPNFLQDIILLMGALFIALLNLLIPLVLVVSGIIIVVCFIVHLVGGKCPDGLENGILDEYNDFLTQIKNGIIGCGKGHPSPTVRSYIQNVCMKCGIEFVSSIYNDTQSEYYNTVYFNAPVKKGCEDCNTLIRDNVPIKTLDMFLDELKPVHNAAYMLNGTTLYFERKDKLKLQVTAFDFTGADKSKLLGGICYEWNGEKKPAYMNVEYQKDAFDLVGNESADHYNDIVDFNNPPNAVFSGELKKTFPFGTARFRDDGIEKDVLSNAASNNLFETIINENKNALLLAQQTASLPKLLIWDGISQTKGTVKIYPTPAGYAASYPNGYTTYKLYNYPYYCDADFNDVQKNLWEFQKIDNPKDPTIKNITWTLKFRYDCGDLGKLSLLAGVVLTEGIGWITEYEISPSEHSVTLRGQL